MTRNVAEALRRAKALLGEGADPEPAPMGRLAAFDKIAAEARSYLAGNAIADDVGIEIKFTKGEFEACFERS